MGVYNVQLFDTILRSQITSLVLALLLAALSPITGRFGVKAQKSYFWVAATVVWLRTNLGPEARGLSWSLWFVVAVSTAVVFGFIAYYVGQACEPPLPDVFLFRHSTLFTPERKKSITRTLVAFRGYLLGLGFAFSLKKLPIGVGDATSHGWGQAEQIGANHITLTADQIDDREALTYAYALYVVSRDLANWQIQAFDAEQWARLSMGDILARYFSWSFWDKRNDSVALGSAPQYVNAFWSMRERFSKQFVDDLLSCMVRSFREGSSPFGSHVYAVGETVKHTDVYLNQVFQSHLQNADREAGSHDVTWPAISEVLQLHGIDIVI